MSMTSAAAMDGAGLPELIARLVGGDDLDASQTETAFRLVMEGRATPIQIASLLVALRVRRETPSHVAGGVRALRSAMVPVAADTAGLVDTCGTGGGLSTFNISTAAALLAAGAGVRIAKHGNRSFTSRCGSADVLAELGVTIELTPDAMARVLGDAGIVFMFAPLLHPAMRHVAPVRRELGFGTIMNVLGPLTNPAGARRQVVGVADPALLHLIAGALAELEHERALIVHGEPGMDEISPIGPTRVVEVDGSSVREYTLDPTDFFPGARFNADDLAGGEPAHNAAVVRGVLAGTIRGAPRAAVLLNAGAAIYASGRTGSIREGMAWAERVLDAGGGTAALERLRAATLAASGKDRDPKGSRSGRK
jgi:anthranilate phosphoribosyltransferase